MVRKALTGAGALAALVSALAATPAVAQNVGDDSSREEAREARAERREAGEIQQAQRSEARDEWQQQRAEARASGGWRAPEVRSVEATSPRVGDEGGWRTQHRDGDRHDGRDWSADGEVSRPDAAWRGAILALPERPAGQATGTWGERNRTYSDPARDGSYHAGTNDRDRRWRDRDPTQSYGYGYRGGSQDWTGSRYATSRYSGDYRRWDRRDWRRDSRYNWYSYRNYNRGLFSVGQYYSPYSNYRYNRLGIGIFLDSGFYGNRYWISDPWQYRLPQAYGPYRWVRYYHDVLLVDIYSGEVVDVIYDFFW